MGPTSLIGFQHNVWGSFFESCNITEGFRVEEFHAAADLQL